MEASEQSRVIEALILASTEPVSVDRLARIVPGLTSASAKELINGLNATYQESGRAFEIWEVAGGFQLRTLAEFSGYLQQLRKERPLRLSQAALETLSIIAYKQPVTRAELEQVRGVDAGAVIRGLLDRRLLRIAGHREVPGRPLLYATSRRFLEVFGLESLKNLPALRELEELAREEGVALPGLPQLGGADGGTEESVSAEAQAELALELPSESGVVEPQPETATDLSDEPGAVEPQPEAAPGLADEPGESDASGESEEPVWEVDPESGRTRIGDPSSPTRSEPEDAV